MYNWVHIFPQYPKLIHFVKLLLNITLREYRFTTTFQCIHQFCLFPGRKGKEINLVWSRVFSFCTVFLPITFHPCIKLMTIKLQLFPCEVPKKFNVVCNDYLVILVLHRTFISHVCLFKIHVTVASVNWAVF